MTDIIVSPELILQKEALLSKKLSEMQTVNKQEHSVRQPTNLGACAAVGESRSKLRGHGGQIGGSKSKREMATEVSTAAMQNLCRWKSQHQQR